MAFIHSPKIVTDGLIFVLDAANNKSYAGSGTNWTDLSGNNNSGSLTNGPTFNSANGGSIVFDGSNDFVLISSSSLPLFDLYTSPFTIECTIKTDIAYSSLNTFSRIISMNNGTRNIQLGMARQTPDVTPLRTFYILNDNVASLPGRVTSGDIPFGTINHVVATFNGTSTYNIYLNGVLANGVYVGNTIATYLVPSGSFTIGQRGDNAGYLNGNIYNVKIYNKALSANEVLQNFNATRGRFGV